MTLTILSEALAGEIDYFRRLPDVANMAARMALNDVARGSGMKLLRAAIEKQVHFPPGYVNNDRLFVSQPARNDKLEVHITARQRPTSLARFAQGATLGKRGGGVKVEVHHGSLRPMKSAFLVRLRAGAALSNEQFNVGLAIRLKPGQRLVNKRVQTQLGHNVYLLYGPSIDQVFREVAAEEAPHITPLVENEFLRQFTRLAG